MINPLNGRALPGRPLRHRDRRVAPHRKRNTGLAVDREPLGDGSDLKQIADLLRDGDDEAGLRDQVRGLLELNAGTVRWLAAKLARRGSLSGNEVERVVRG